MSFEKGNSKDLKIEKNPESNILRNKIVAILKPFEEKEFGKELSKMVIQFTLDEIDKDPVCNKHLSTGTELLQSYEKIKNKIDSKESNYFLLEQEIKELLGQIYQEELADCVLDSDFDSFQNDTNNVLDKILRDENIVLTPELAERLDSLNNFLTEKSKNRREQYIANVWAQNELTDILTELSRQNENISLNQEITSLEKNPNLKIPEFSKDLNSILDHKLNAELGNAELLELNNKMAEFLKRNQEYTGLWENLKNGKPVNSKEFRSFTLSFRSFANITLTLTLASLLLTGCDNVKHEVSNFYKEMKADSEFKEKMVHDEIHGNDLTKYERTVSSGTIINEKNLPAGKTYTVRLNNTDPRFDQIIDSPVFKIIISYTDTDGNPQKLVLNNKNRRGQMSMIEKGSAVLIEAVEGFDESFPLVFENVNEKADDPGVVQNQFRKWGYNSKSN